MLIKTGRPLSTGQRADQAVMLYSYGVKAGVVHIWWKVKMCEV